MSCGKRCGRSTGEHHMTAVPNPSRLTNHKPAIIPLPGLSATTLPFPCSMIQKNQVKTINREFDHIFRFICHLPTPIPDCVRLKLRNGSVRASIVLLLKKHAEVTIHRLPKKGKKACTMCRQQKVPMIFPLQKPY